MRTILQLFLTLLCVGSAAPVIFTFTIGGMVTLDESGHSTIATLLPWLVLVVGIFLTKLVYKGFGYLIRTIFG